MFGRIQAAREQRREQKRNQEALREIGYQQSLLGKNQQDAAEQNYDWQNSQANKRVEQAKEDRKKAYGEGRERAEEIFSRKVQGLDPEKRKALQYEANKGIQRNVQSANRKLLGEQSQRGILGKGGVGYAQQRDLQKMGLEAQAGVNRDLDKLNSDLELKKLAAMIPFEQGEAAQAQLDRQLALDELQFEEEKKRQRGIESTFNRLFSRI